MCRRYYPNQCQLQVHLVTPQDWYSTFEATMNKVIVTRVQNHEIISEELAKRDLIPPMAIVFEDDTSTSYYKLG